MLPWDEIMTEPTLANKDGAPQTRAWRLNLDACYAKVGKQRSEGGDVATWLVEAPWAHPFWHSYWIQLNHLRPTPGLPELKFYLPGATHELWVAALDPDQPRQAMIDTGDMKHLRPLNFAAQLIEDSDHTAAYRVQQAVKAICQGTLSPDTDFRAQWISRFGDNMMAK